MGYPRTMGAGLAGSTTKIYGNANVNQIQYGDKLQGLPPVTGRRDPYRIYKTKAGGNAPGRFRVFCVNQLGGIGMANKNSQFAPNADGLGWCPNRKNSREGDIGINKADRGHDAIRFQSRADEKAEFEISANSFSTISFSDLEKLTKLLNQLPKLKPDQLYAAMGKEETLSGDLLGLTSQEQETRVVKEPSNIVGPINSIIGDPHLWMNRKYNGKGAQQLGIHRLVILTREDEIKLREAGYGVELVRYGDKVFSAFWYSWCPWCG